MLVPTISLLLLLAEQPASVDPRSSRQIAAPCPLVEERAIQFLKNHEFYTERTTFDEYVLIVLGNRKNASTPSGKPLSLNRFTIHKYTLPRHLSPFKAYADFRAEGRLRLEKAAEGFCNASLHFEITAYEWVWALGIIDDGYASKFISNGTLERLYLDAIDDLFAKAGPNFETSGTKN